MTIIISCSDMSPNIIVVSGATQIFVMDCEESLCGFVKNVVKDLLNRPSQICLNSANKKLEGMWTRYIYRLPILQRMSSNDLFSGATSILNAGRGGEVIFH